MISLNKSMLKNAKCLLIMKFQTIIILKKVILIAITQFTIKETAHHLIQ